MAALRIPSSASSESDRVTPMRVSLTSTENAMLPSTGSIATSIVSVLLPTFIEARSNRGLTILGALTSLAPLVAIRASSSEPELSTMRRSCGGTSFEISTTRTCHRIVGDGSDASSAARVLMIA